MSRGFRRNCCWRMSLKCSRMALYTQYERVPAEGQMAAFRELVKQRANHVPVAYLIGKAWFFSLEFKVTRDVLIPRRGYRNAGGICDSACAAAAGVGGAGAMPAILDLCTGSGMIPIALAKRLPTAGFDGDGYFGKALAVAKENAESTG